MMWAALLLIVLGWSGAIVGAAWRARWLIGAVGGLTATLIVIEAAQHVGSAQPIGYGIALGISIFLAAAMAILGIIAAGVKWLARRER